MNNELKVILNNIISQYGKTLSDADNTEFDPNVFNQLKERESQAIEALGDLEKRANGESDELKNNFRKGISPWYKKSKLMTHALEKPFNYPGDYQMLELLYGQESKSQGIGRYLDELFFHEPLAIAVVNRKNYVKNWLAKNIKESNRLDIFNIASGSAREWYELMQELKPEEQAKVHLTNLDNEINSLNFVKERMKDFKGNIDYQKGNIVRLSTKGFRKRMPDNYKNQDIVYSIGLYDYLPDKMLTGIINTQYDMLNKNGKMLIAFKDIEQYDPTVYDWCTDWKFVPRNPKQIDNILKDANIDTYKVTREPSNIVIFYEIQKS